MNSPPEKLLEWRNVQAFPVAHGRLGFALEVRRLMLETRFDTLAVELPPSLEPAIREAISLLPQISLVTYRNHPEFIRSDQVNLFYVPVDPADPVIESLRIALGERTPIHFIDADVSELTAPAIMLPDAFALQAVGIEAYYRLALPYLRGHAPLSHDPIREKHMAARLRALSDQLGPKKRILFVCGLAHWENIRKALDQNTDEICEESGPDPSLISVRPAHMSALPYVVSELPHTIWHYERHRRRITSEPYDPTEGLKILLLNARVDYEREFQGSFERVTTRALETLLRYARKLTIHSGRLFPDAYHLILAAKSVIGNDYALCVLHRIAEYPPNGRPSKPPIQIVNGEALSEAGPE
ncbi:MAG TPA: hypothetical protein PKA37_01910, partial [Planctomycetota bacterium]|nr:hypothetical protein [Planctomycetota bacterium]